MNRYFNSSHQFHEIVFNYSSYNQIKSLLKNTGLLLDVIGILLSASVFLKTGWRSLHAVCQQWYGSTAVLQWDNTDRTFTWWLMRAISKPDLVHVIAAGFHFLLSTCSFCSLTRGRRYLEQTLGQMFLVISCRFCRSHLQKNPTEMNTSFPSCGSPTI